MTKKKILIVDDIYPNRFLLEQTLSDYDCIHASDGAQMWAVLKSAMPDLILMDIGLPGDDGLVLAKKLAADERYAAIPVIFVTAHSTKREIIEAAHAGGYGYLLKPVDENILRERIVQALNKQKTAGRNTVS